MLDLQLLSPFFSTSSCQSRSIPAMHFACCRGIGQPTVLPRSKGRKMLVRYIGWIETKKYCTHSFLLLSFCFCLNFFIPPPPPPPKKKSQPKQMANQTSKKNPKQTYKQFFFSSVAKFVHNTNIYTVRTQVQKQQQKYFFYILCTWVKEKWRAHRLCL